MPDPHDALARIREWVRARFKLDADDVVVVSVGGGSNAPAFYSRNQYHYAEDLDMIRGRHHLSFGAEARTMVSGSCAAR